MNELKIVLWIGDAPNQKALACKLDSERDICAIVIEKHKPAALTLSKFISKFYDKIFFSEINDAWFEMLNKYNVKFPRYPQCEIYETEKINDAGVKSFTLKHNPDLILVSGTSLIKKELLELKPKIGILNLHTGLSPYIKGGPNCTNWCIANNSFHLIGNTIMWIDEGIDSGNIVTTKVTSFDGNENLKSIHIKVMEEAHQLYLDVIKVAKVNPGILPNVKQGDISEGKTFYSKNWNSSMKRKLLSYLKNNYWKKTIHSEEYRMKLNKLKTVQLPKI